MLETQYLIFYGLITKFNNDGNDKNERKKVKKGLDIFTCKKNKVSIYDGQDKNKRKKVRKGHGIYT